MSTSAFKDCKFISAWPPFYTTDEQEVVAAKDARIAVLEKQIADMTAERLRKAGAYYVVPKETLDAKDARIAELKHLRSCEGVVLTGRIKDLETTLRETRAAMVNANRKEERLLNEEGKYDKCGVDGIGVDSAVKAAKLAQSSLNMKYKLSYAAACLLVLHREYESLKESISEENKRNGAVAKKEMIDKIVNGVYKSIRVDESGIHAVL